MKEKSINLPTKITISRIALATVLLLGVFVIYLLDEFSVINVSSFNINIYVFCFL